MVSYDYGTWIDSGRNHLSYHAWCKNILVDSADFNNCDRYFFENVENNQTGSCYKINISGTTRSISLLNIKKFGSTNL